METATDNTKSEAQGASFDQADDPVQEPSQKKAEDTLDLLVSRAEPKEWTLGKEAYERVYVQRPLSFIAKMQWFSLVGEVLDKAMSGEHALSMNNLLSAPDARGSLTMDDFRDADTFVQAVGKLLVYAPDFLEKSFCIWLGVPDYERESTRQIMALPAEDGGLSDDDGLEIIEIFIDQNYGALDSFFREKLATLRSRVEARQKEASASRSSRR
jgi:hypothetical protein